MFPTGSMRGRNVVADGRWKNKLAERGAFRSLRPPCLSPLFSNLAFARSATGRNLA